MLFFVHPFLSLAPDIPAAILLSYPEHLFLSCQWKIPKTSCLLGGTKALPLKSLLHFSCLQTSFSICCFPPSPFAVYPLVGQQFSLIAKGLSLFDPHCHVPIPPTGEEDTTPSLSDRAKSP